MHMTTRLQATTAVNPKCHSLAEGINTLSIMFRFVSTLRTTHVHENFILSILYKFPFSNMSEIIKDGADKFYAFLLCPFAYNN